MSIEQEKTIEKYENETVITETKKSPIKRFLSWMTIFVESIIFYYILYLFLRIVFALNDFASNLGGVAYAILLVCFATTAFGAYIWGSISLSCLSVKISNKVCTTKKGTRYIAVGIIGIILYAINIFGMIAGYATSEQPVFFYLLFAGMIIYYISMIIFRKTEDIL